VERLKKKGRTSQEQRRALLGIEESEGGLPKVKGKIVKAERGEKKKKHPPGG